MRRGQPGVYSPWSGNCQERELSQPPERDGWVEGGPDVPRKGQELGGKEPPPALP